MFDVMNALRRFDRGRPSLPGEHWATFATGVYYLTRRQRGLVGGLAAKAFGMALVLRAISGRDGALAMLRRPPRSRSGAPRERTVEIAAPWPHEQRVRIVEAARD